MKDTKCWLDWNCKFDHLNDSEDIWAAEFEYNTEIDSALEDTEGGLTGRVGSRSYCEPDCETRHRQGMIEIGIEKDRAREESKLFQSHNLRSYTRERVRREEKATIP
jgi:hypothetical protein